MQIAHRWGLHRVVAQRKYIAMRDMVLCLSCLALLVGITRCAHGQESIQAFRVGFSRSLFTDVNDADARASIKVWAQTVAKERNVDMDPTAQIFDSLEKMTEALKRGLVDSISTTFEEYFALATKVELDHFFLTKTSGNLYEEYILLVQEEGGIDSPDDLLGNTLSLHHSARTCLARYWLDSIFSTSEFSDKTAENDLSIKYVPKISKAVLPVFFGQTDACVVAQSGFMTMKELNPQIGRKLKILAKSQPLVPAIMCFRKDFDSPHKEQLLNSLRDLHNTRAGQQVLTIFQAEALVEVDLSALEETGAFLTEINRVRPGRQTVKTENDVVTSPEYKRDSDS